MANIEKITKNMIIDAGIEEIRLGNKPSARNIAKHLHCSTQPIYRLFENMNSLEIELRNNVQLIHNKFINEYIGKSGLTNYKAFGMAFVRFAGQESELFKFLYMNYPSDPPDKAQKDYYNRVIDEICIYYKVSREVAENFHKHMSIYAYGLAVIQSISKNISDDDISKCLSDEFLSLKKHFID